MIEVKPLTEETLRDAEEVVRSRFGEKGVDILYKAMRNPMRKLCVEVGDIAYEDGRPACFQASMLRFLQNGDKRVVGIVGGLTCRDATASFECMIDLRLAANKPRGGCELGFGNSQCAETAGMSKRIKGAFRGPESTSRYLQRVINPGRLLWYGVFRKVLRRPPAEAQVFQGSNPEFVYGEGKFKVIKRIGFDAKFFDVLMTRYLTTNKGLVCSRTSEELEWYFGDKMKDGSAIVLAAEDTDGPVGYIVLGRGETAIRCMIMDIFAVGNRLDIIEILLKAAIRFLRKKTKYLILTTCGFPTFVQPLLKKYLPRERKMEFNMFSWGSSSKTVREELLPIIDTPKSWFFGPYDGDLCM